LWPRALEPDPLLDEPVAGRRARQRRAQDEPVRLAYPLTELLAPGILINLQVELVFNPEVACGRRKPTYLGAFGSA
jgi:hypothetical protein